jgi:hypothetical protein
LKTFFSLFTFILGFGFSLLPLFAMLGLGLHRHAPSWAISATATLLIFGPALLVTGLVKQDRLMVFGATVGIWSIGIFFGLPIYFPGERQQAVVTGMSLVGFDENWEALARKMADRLPPEPEVAEPELPEAILAPSVASPGPLALAPHQIALPYEGEGRRLTVELAIEHNRHIVEIDMMLDTGATYTTLPLPLLKRLGVTPSPDDPQITLQTANGSRDAQLILLDRLWLGDLAIDGVVVATCDSCASQDTSGLLGLNVTGGYNLNIDADRREVVFTTRQTNNRQLDIKPFVDIRATVSKFQGGRVEVETEITNAGPRGIHEGQLSIHCKKQKWMVPFTRLETGDTQTNAARLPSHDPCDQYQVGLHEASW